MKLHTLLFQKIVKIHVSPTKLSSSTNYVFSSVCTEQFTYKHNHFNLALDKYFPLLQKHFQDFIKLHFTIPFRIPQLIRAPGIPQQRI